VGGFFMIYKMLCDHERFSREMMTQFDKTARKRVIGLEKIYSFDIEHYT
jgi:hypothetical protein